METVSIIVVIRQFDDSVVVQILHTELIVRLESKFLIEHEFEKF